MNSTKFVLSLTHLCKELEKEFPKKKVNIDSIRTFLYEIIENLLPMEYNYLGQKIKVKQFKNENDLSNILESLNYANSSILKKDFDSLTDHLIHIEANAMDIALAVKTVRKNIIKIVDEIHRVHFPENK
jgi:hypothetical protein